jgi:hypothetical protein
MSDKLADWTKGAEAIVYQSCGACGPCSISTAASAPPAARRSGRSAPAGQGRLCDVAGMPRRDAGDARARSLQHRSGRYGGGFRMMAHGDIDLAIGDKVTVSYRPFAGRLIPYFEKHNLASNESRRQMLTLRSNLRIYAER